MTTPIRKIVETANSHKRTRRGILHTATLECGHLATVNAAERRRGTVYCFDCSYGKPPHPQGLITLEQIRNRQGNAVALQHNSLIGVALAELLSKKE
jgi:hypothetical protein